MSAPAAGVIARPTPPTGEPEAARRLFAAAEVLQASPDRARFHEALKAYLAYADAHRKGLEESAVEVASRLDEAAMALYRGSEPDLASRAIELGLVFAPGSASLQHHRAVVLLAQNRNLDEVLPLLESALAGNPHDKQIWATKGDALKLLNRPDEAAEAYLKAQQLDATSMQYVERALKVVPSHPVALRMKLQLARAHGGDKQALEACDALLSANPTDASLLLARAELLSALGEVDLALVALEKAGAANPDDPHVAVLRGRLFLATGKSAEAIAEFGRLLESDTTLDVGALGEMADAFEHAGDVNRAIDARQKIRALEPRNIANLTALRAIAAHDGRTDVALEACRGVLESSPDNLEALRATAELLGSAGRTDEAVAAYRHLLERHPREVGEARHAVEYVRSLNTPSLVVEFARLLLTEDPADPMALEELARSLLALGDKEAALAAYDGLLKQRPSDSALLAEKKQLLTELGRADELLGVYDELFRVDPTRSDLALERGHLYLARAFECPEGAPEREPAAREALVSYERASSDPALASPSLLGVARASRLVRDPERSVRAYRDFLADASNAQRADVLKELGHALRELGRLSEAESVYAHAVELGLEDPDLFWAETEVLSLLNQEAKALRFVDLLLQRDPNNPLFLRRRGQLLLKAGRSAEGLAVLQQAVSLAHGDPHVHFEVAEALRASGAYTDAVTYFRQGLEVDPHNRPGRLALAETLALAGQYNDAIPIVDDLLREDANDVAAWRARADAYRRLQRTPELLYSLKAILLLDPHNASALLEKYRLHLEHEEKAEAYECLGTLLESGGTEATDPALFLQHGDLSAELGRTEEANRSYEKAAQLDPAQLGEIAVRRARLRLTAGRPDLALEVLDAALQGTGTPGPRSAPALLLRAEILTALERPAEAQAVYEEVRATEPKSPVAVAGIGRTLLDQGKHAEAKAFLVAALPQVAASAQLYLLLAEAEAGLGALPEAVATVQRGTELLPRTASLWVRLGELQVAREAWSEAAGAFAHAIVLDGANPDLQLRAGFVAERLGHPNEALALYDRATQVAPSNKNAWCSRGLALLAIGRSDEALASFDRALGLDSDFEPAKEGKKAAVQKTREGQIERFGREALLLEAKLRRTVTKNDLFVTLHVPFDLLEPVLTSLARNPRIDLDRLSEAEMRDLESASYHLIATALDRRPEGIERRGFTLADVAVLSPPTASLDQIQRLFGYLRTVLEADVRPENLHLSPDVEDLARRALLLPANQRTLFQLVKTLRVGLFKARLIKAVESAGAAVHAPTPSLDLGQYSPEFRAPETGPPDGEEYFAPENVPAPEPPTAPVASQTAHHGPRAPGEGTATPSLRCVGCGGIAAIVHDCGSPVCQHCIAQFHTCPKCSRPISPVSAHAVPVDASEPPAHPSHAAGHAGHGPADAARSGSHPSKSPASRARPAAPKSVTPAPHPAPHPARDTESAGRPAPGSGGGRPTPPPVPVGGPAEEPAAPPRPAHTRPKPDDEPRL